MKYKVGDIIQVLSPYQSWVKGKFIKKSGELLSVELESGHIVYLGEGYTRQHRESSLILDTSELLIELLEENHRLLAENEKLKADEVSLENAYEKGLKSLREKENQLDAILDKLKEKL